MASSKILSGGVNILEDARRLLGSYSIISLRNQVTDNIITNFTVNKLNSYERSRLSVKWILSSNGYCLVFLSFDNSTTLITFVRNQAHWLCTEYHDLDRHESGSIGNGLGLVINRFTCLKF
jgi:hypothetical protein